MENFLEFLNSVHPNLVYLGLCLGAYIENIFPPAPGDTVVVFGAYLVGIGSLRFDLAYTVTTLGSILGFMTYFYLGRKLGRRYLADGQNRFISAGLFKKVDAWFDKYGYTVVAANRFFSGARSVISLVAGAVGMDQLKVFLLALLSCMVWNFILIYAGYSLGDNWEIVIGYIKTYNKVVLIAVICVIILLIVRHILRKNKTVLK